MLAGSRNSDAGWAAQQRRRVRWAIRKRGQTFLGGPKFCRDPRPVRGCR